MHPGKYVSLSDGVLSSHSFLHRPVNPGVSQEITVLAGRQASIPLFWPSPKKKAPATQAPNIDAVEPKLHHYPAAPQYELSFLGYDWAVFPEFRL